jgi:hypothetical protein
MYSVAARAVAMNGSNIRAGIEAGFNIHLNFGCLKSKSCFGRNGIAHTRKYSLAVLGSVLNLLMSLDNLQFLSM